MLLQQIVNIAKQLYGTPPRLLPLWSAWKRVYVLDFGPALPEKVIKVSGGQPWQDDEIRREQQVLRALPRYNVSVPPIEYTQDDLPAAPWSFTLMPRLGPYTLGEWYAHGHGNIDELFTRTGQCLAQLQSLPYQTIGGIIDQPTILAHENAQLARNRTYLHTDNYCKILDEIEYLLHSAPRVFTHRDFHLGQILTDGSQGWWIIDWTDAGVGFAYSDLGKCLAMARRYWHLSAEDSARMLSGFTVSAGGALEQIHLWEKYWALNWLAEAIECKDGEKMHGMEQLLASLDNCDREH